MFSQNINILVRAGILENISHNKKSLYIIKDNLIIEKIAHSIFESYNFLIKYTLKFIEDNDLNKEFERFKLNNNSEGLNYLVKDLNKFILTETNIKNKYEPSRIFNKIINIYSYEYGLYGRKRGNLSKQIISFDEIKYGRTNFRDLNKETNLTRKEHKNNKLNTNQFEVFFENKAKNLVKRMNVELFNNKIDVDKEIELTVNDSHAHHIFPKKDFLQFCDMPENIILLSPTTHLSYAHQHGDTKNINKVAQKEFILKQIDKLFFDKEEKYFSKENMCILLNKGLSTNLFKKEFTKKEFINILDTEYK
jgi:hypothetical protein